MKYDESIRPGLRETIERLAPETIAINYSPSDPAADGLTHGLWLVLSETLEGTPYADRLVSSKPIVGSLRGRKSSFEIARIRAAIAETEEIFAHVADHIGPGMKETEIAAVMQAEVSRRGLGYAWEEDHCPAVNAGPEKEVGHSGPSELQTRAASSCTWTSASRRTRIAAICSVSGTCSTTVRASRPRTF